MSQRGKAKFHTYKKQLEELHDENHPEVGLGMLGSEGLVVSQVPAVAGSERGRFVEHQLGNQARLAHSCV